MVLLSWEKIQIVSGGSKPGVQGKQRIRVLLGGQSISVPSGKLTSGPVIANLAQGSRPPSLLANLAQTSFPTPLRWPALRQPPSLAATGGVPAPLQRR